MVNFIMAGYKDNLLGEANSFIEVLEQVSIWHRWISLSWLSVSEYWERAYCQPPALSVHPLARPVYFA
jgi:hypothetical protein